MRLTELFRLAGIVPDAIDGDAELNGLCADSRTLRTGEAFYPVPSPTGDSHRFIDGALARGATALIVHSQAAFDAWKSQIPVGLVEAHRYESVAWALAKAAYGEAIASLQLVGVTGTNGKTTVAWIVRDMLEALDIPAAYLGTLGFEVAGERRTLENTTPFAVDVYRLLAEARERGAKAVAMEVSSHALAQRRVDGLEFDVAAFTNLSQDHLDFHGDFDAYMAAKRRLFVDLPRDSDKVCVAAINLDDADGARLAAKLDIPVLGFSKVAGAMTYEAVHVAADCIALNWTFEGETFASTARLGGRFNVENCACAIAIALGLGIEPERVAKALNAARPAPGRFEAAPNDAGISILIDYAHTPDALEKLLDAVRELEPRRVVTVFGCGGDRDATKRPLMARAASQRSDLTILTSDNPRTEDPAAILAQVAAGIEPGSESLSIIDRREAVAKAIAWAEPGDIVVIAGKGHENYQIIGREKFHLDDRELVQDALRARAGAPR